MENPRNDKEGQEEEKIERQSLDENAATKDRVDHENSSSVLLRFQDSVRQGSNLPEKQKDSPKTELKKTQAKPSSTTCSPRSFNQLKRKYTNEEKGKAVKFVDIGRVPMNTYDQTPGFLNKDKNKIEMEIGYAPRLKLDHQQLGFLYEKKGKAVTEIDSSFLAWNVYEQEDEAIGQLSDKSNARRNRALSLFLEGLDEMNEANNLDIEAGRDFGEAFDLYQKLSSQIRAVIQTIVFSNE